MGASVGLVAALMTGGVASAAGPITKGPWMQHVTPTSAVVLVEVDPPAPVTIEVGMGAAVGSTDAGAGSVIESREVRQLHSILVKGLEPATRYPFTVRVSGAARYGAITTAPREESGDPFRFLVYGDNRSDDATHAAVVVSMVSRASSFLINTGDLVERGSSRSEWQSFFDIEAPLTRERPIFSCVGNHELTDGAGLDYVRYFGPADLPKEVVAPAAAVTGIPLHDAGSPKLTLDQLSGTFRWSNARFFMVNGMVPYTTGPTRAWLERALGDSDDEPGLVWRIVVVHHGPWSSGPHGDNKILHDGNVPQLLRAHKVDLVLAGHDHIYERGSADGLAYLVSGGGGSPVYRVKKAEKTSRRYESVHHFVEAFVSPAAIQFVAIRPDGSTIESCALAKGIGWTCDGSAEGGAGPAPALSSSSSRCGCRTAGSDGAPSGRNAGLLFVAACAAGTALLTRRARRRFMR
ncbi:MAG: Purple acid phosphatase [Myxococcaceae bacterium]|nr:Purple acid phosphatase [Myxococcaceae bacterium]